MDIKDLLYSEIKKNFGIEDRSSTINVYDCSINVEFLKNYCILKTVIKREDDSEFVDNYIKLLELSCLGRGTNYGWFGCSDDKSIKKIYFIKVLTSKEMNEKNIKGFFQNFVYVVDMICSSLENVAK